MKKTVIYVLLMIFTLFSFNLTVFAQEVDTNANDNNNQEEVIETSEEENLEEINEENIEEELDEQEDLEEDLDDIGEDGSDGFDNSEEDSDELEDEIVEDEIKIQHTKVLISKVNEKGELIVGATLQVIDSNGEVVYEWISDGTVHEIVLGAGKYILHEVSAPEGYQIAEDQEFEVEVIIEDEIIGDANMSEIPCDHGEDNKSPMYYIEINNVSYEVYCINQGLATPNGIGYNGQIVTPEDLRNFTKQETNIDGEGFTISGTRINVNTETVLDFDVSDQTLTDEELYNKVLDIIYHRNLVTKDERFNELSIEEIRYITEIALKNYLNARITTYETVRELNGTTIKHLSYNKDGELWETGDGTKYIKLYNKYYNREYLFDETSPTGYVITSGLGDALGNFAKHWYHYHNKTKMPAIYAELYYYLVSEEESHPEDMKLFMYSPVALTSDSPYQNLLGITGYLEDVEMKEQVIEMLDKYSEEVRNITVEKEWNDGTILENDRPENVTVNLYENDVIIKSVELNEDNNWTYTFEGLNVYREGNKIVYTIDENQVEKYNAIITGNMEDGFTVTNTHERYGMGSPIPPQEEIRNPQTSDNIVKNIVMLIIGLIGMFSLLISIKIEKTYS